MEHAFATYLRAVWWLINRALVPFGRQLAFVRDIRETGVVNGFVTYEPVGRPRLLLSRQLTGSTHGPGAGK